MSRCIVTGAAGFIGSHLCQALLAGGHQVVGIDSFVPYYPRPLKEHNLSGWRDHPAFEFHERDLRYDDLRSLVEGGDAVFNLAAMAGLMKSWTDFEGYNSCNVLAAQRLLQAVCDARVPHLLHVSTSSVYGREAEGDETRPLRPASPYGVTKLAGEHLCRAYSESFGLQATVLRYFSVYGPRQRPDMAYHILVRCLLEKRPFTVYGDGEQSRSNTYVDDCVAATLLAFEQPRISAGRIFNIGGGEVVSLNHAISLLEELTGRSLRRVNREPRPGDQTRTAADISRARELLGYRPVTPVRTGLQRQIEWMRRALDDGALHAL